MHVYVSENSSSSTTTGYANRASICFSRKTALQILRAARQDACDLPKDESPAFPEHPPSIKELQLQLERLESIYPTLRFQKPIHLAVGSASCRASGLYKPHVCTKALSNDSLMRLDETLLTNAELALVHMATQIKGDIPLLELGWELCGSYQTQRTGMQSAYQVKQLTSTRKINAFISQNASAHGARKVARILPYLADKSASPRESKFAMILGLPIARGGYGLGLPQMNYEVKCSKEARMISGRGCLRCDLCWPNKKVDVEYQSRESHEGEVSRIRDSRRTNALLAMGWTVISVTNDELDSFVATDAIAQSIRRCIGKRVQVRIPDHRERKLELRRQLSLPSWYK